MNATRSPIGRRALLQALCALGCAPLLDSVARGQKGQGGVRALVTEPALEAARRVGERCRAAGVHADESALLAGFTGRSTKELAAHLAGKIRADFAADRLVTVGAWWLAETEAAVLALL